MRKLAIIAFACLSACGETASTTRTPDQALSSEQAAIAQREAESVAGRQLSVRFVCGASRGRGYFLDTPNEGWVEDGITDGRLVFATDANGENPNVFFRDSGGRYLSARDDGAAIAVLSVPNDPSGSVWIISYLSTGVVETHNISGGANQLVDLWNSNKPQSMLGRPRVQAFMANCARP